MAVLATAVWRVRPSGNNANGGGYDPGIAGAATDYSQQNAAQATGTNGAGSATTTFTDSTAAAFTAAMVGNAINITGQGFYFVVAFLTASTVTVDRALGTFSGATWHLGGGWANFWTNINAAGTPLTSGNTVYILGSGTPNPAAYTYDYDQTAQLTTANVANPNGTFNFANDPATPGYKAPPDTTGGMPVIKWDVAAIGFAYVNDTAGTVSGLWIVGTTTAASLYYATVTNHPATFLGCVLDQFSFDLGLGQGSGTIFLGCEVFSSVAPGAAGNQGAFGIGDFRVNSCNIHDCVGYGINAGTSRLIVVNSIIANCRKDGILVNIYIGGAVVNCTIDGNLGNGINVTTGYMSLSAFNNIISNHTQAGKSGLNLGSGSTGFADFNVYYNNTTDITNGTYGPHDTHGGSNPYVGQATENYTLA